MAVIKEVFASWQNSSYTDHLHAKATVDCAGCHGKQMPLLDSTVANDRCLACHGPLAQLSPRASRKISPNAILMTRTWETSPVPCAIMLTPSLKLTALIATVISTWRFPAELSSRFSAS